MRLNSAIVAVLLVALVVPGLAALKFKGQPAVPRVWSDLSADEDGAAIRDDAGSDLSHSATDTPTATSTATVTRTRTSTASVTPTASPSRTPSPASLCPSKFGQVCAGNGTCFDGNCECAIGYQGSDCSQKSTTDPCTNACPPAQHQVCAGINAAGNAVCVCAHKYSGTPPNCVLASGYYQVGPWSPCSASCNNGTQTRTVHCVNTGGEVLDASDCDSPAPASSQACNTFSCNNIGDSVSVSANILFDFRSYDNDATLVDAFGTAIVTEITDSITTFKKRVTFTSLNTTTGAVSLMVLPANAAGLRTTPAFRFAGAAPTAQDLAAALDALVHNSAALQALHTTWLRRVNPASYRNSTVAPSASPSPSLSPSPAISPSPSKPHKNNSGGNTAVIVVVVVIVALLVGVGVFAYFRRSSTAQRTEYDALAAGPTATHRASGGAGGGERSGTRVDTGAGMTSTGNRRAVEMKRGESGGKNPATRPLISDSDSD